jgi:hypothetical protein
MLNLLRVLGYGIDLDTLSSRAGVQGTGATRPLSAEACGLLETGCRLDQGVLHRVNVSGQAKREITTYLLGMCSKVSARPLKTVAFLAKLLDLDMNQCYMR